MALVSTDWNASNPGKLSEHGETFEPVHLYPQFEFISIPAGLVSCDAPYRHSEDRRIEMRGTYRYTLAHYRPTACSSSTSYRVHESRRTHLG